MFANHAQKVLEFLWKVGLFDVSFIVFETFQRRIRLFPKYI